jgi:serine phosphatase RsbU (regulator of sigma subunit)/DNA-binding transcriptional regulator YhcF (GntR family)
MILNLTDLSAEPLHRQISAQLARRILDAELAAGTDLPSITAMAREQHVSRSTVELAYTELAQEGLIRLRSHRGPTVADLLPEERQAAAARLGLSSHSLLDAIESFSGRLVSIVDRHKMCSMLVESLDKYVQPAGTIIAWPDTHGGCWSLLGDRTEARKLKTHNDGPFIERLRTTEKPISTPDNGDAGARDGLVGTLQSLESDLVWPLKQGNDLLGLVALGRKDGDLEYSEEDLNLVTIFVNQFSTALGMANMYVGSLEKRRMEHELAAAKQIQASLLPKRLPEQDNLELAAFTSPSGAVGGDFYDYFVIDQSHVGLVIADACGNGVPAAMLISQIQAIVRSDVADGKPIEHTLSHLNRHLQDQAEAGFFATLFYGIVDTATGVLKYANAGHDFPILVRRNGQTEVLASTGPALGVVPDLDHDTESAELHEGDCLAMYTDGITEATSARGKHYGEARLKDITIRCRHRTPDEMLDFIRYDVERYRSQGPSDDDMTMMVIKVNRLSTGESYAA